MHRFYCQHADFTQKTIAITDGHEIHHIKNVLRLKAGDELAVFNGLNQEARVMIVGIKQGEIQARVDALREAAATEGPKIILACAVPKKAKFELIIEKCTELGVDAIIPLSTARTEVVFSKEKIPAKRERFQKIAVNAAKQCGRPNVPEIYPMTSLGEALRMRGPDTAALIPSLNGTPEYIREVLTSLKKAGTVMVFIGPEGDFTPDEMRLAVEHGCVPVSLGNTVLKVDTAAITTVALCRFFLYN